MSQGPDSKGLYVTETDNIVSLTSFHLVIAPLTIPEMCTMPSHCLPSSMLNGKGVSYSTEFSVGQKKDLLHRIRAHYTIFFTIWAVT